MQKSAKKIPLRNIFSIYVDILTKNQKKSLKSAKVSVASYSTISMLILSYTVIK